LPHLARRGRAYGGTWHASRRPRRFLEAPGRAAISDADPAARRRDRHRRRGWC